MFEQLEAALTEVRTKREARDTITAKNQKQIDKLQEEINQASNAVNAAEDKAREEGEKVQNELRGVLPGLSQGRVRQSPE